MMNLTLDKVMNESIWVVKYTGWRDTITGAEVSKLGDRDDIRDIDIVVWEHQPKDLQEFFRDLAEYEESHGWTTIPEFYKILEQIDEQIEANQKFTEEMGNEVQGLYVEGLDNVEYSPCDICEQECVKCYREKPSKCE